jgi:predicted permease
MHVINILAPIFILVAVGAVLRRMRFLDQVFFDGCSKLAYWIGIPCLLLNQIASAKAHLEGAWKVFAVMMVASVVVAALAAMVAYALRLATDRRKTFIHTSFHCNTAFVGLPVIIYALGSGPSSGSLLELASMALAPTVPLINIMSVLILNGYDPSKRGNFLALFGRKIVLNPLVLACLLGLLISALGLALPVALARGLDSLGKMAMPLALLSIGASLNFARVRDNLALAGVAAVLNVMVLPLIGLGLCRLWGLSGAETLIALLFLACPTATSTYVYAQQLKGDPLFASNVIVLSTVLSAFSLWATLYLLLV